jgi:hypothetical protein
MTQGKTPRNEVPLPQLHFVACDDWMKKLGNTAFCAWLTLWTLADRRDKEREYDRVPRNMNELAKDLGISKPTFYNNVVKKLWDYGFIDLVEYELPLKGSKENPVNIIVYRYPQNKYELATKPLEKIRDYETEYKKEVREYKSFLGKKSAPAKESQLKNLTGGNDGSQLKNLTGSQLKNLTGSQLKNLTDQYIFKINKKKINKNNNKEEKNIVVDDCPIIKFLSSKNIRIQKETLDKLKTQASEETIIKAFQIALKKDNPVGYVISMIKNGYDGSEYVPATEEVKKVKNDLPEYIVKQIQEQKSYTHTYVRTEEVNEEKKREALELLRQLGEID